jgi:predicted SnoaL-like aldol condensation-catalyzing enzyme
MKEKNKQLVRQALDELFQKKNLAAIERYFAADYRQHNPFVANGAEGLRTFATQAIVPNPGFTALCSHVLGDGELVAVRSRYTGFGPRPHVGFDLFRIQGDTIVEHWDCLQEDEQADDSPFHNATPQPGEGDAETNRALVTAFFNQVLIGGSHQSTADFVAPDSGTALLRDHCVTNGARRYTRLHRTIAEGSVVLTQAEGTINGRPHALYDLFHVHDRKVVGYWGVAQEVTPINTSGLGMF